MKKDDDIILYETTKAIKKPNKIVSRIEINYTAPGKLTTKYIGYHQLIQEIEDMNRRVIHPIYTSSPRGLIHSSKPSVKVGLYTQLKSNMGTYFKKKAARYADEALLSFTKPTGYKRYILKKFSNLDFK